MSTPLLSVIIPVLNGEAFLGEALESASGIRTSTEIILVNDGSTDRSEAIARAYRKFPLIYIEQATAGPAAARNRGLEVAQGEFLAFLDADDVWAEGHPMVALDYLRRHPKVDLALGQTQCLLPENGATEQFAPSGKLFHSYQLGAAVVRRRLIARTGAFNPSMRYGEDVDWFLRVRESGAAISTLPELSLYYRLHPKNQPNVYRSSRIGLLQAFHESMQRRRRLPVNSEKHALISVIIPVHNGERFIADAIESVLAQDYRPLELIVVDDGSTDQTREIVRGFTQATLLEQACAGAGAARNIGIRASRGELLAFLDADDLWEREKLTRQAEKLLTEPDLEAVFGHVAEFGERRAPGGSRPGPIPGTMLIRRSAFERIGFYDEDPGGVEGVDWYLRATEKSLRHQMLPEILYRRRIHGENRTIVNLDPKSYLRALKGSLERRRVSEV